MQEEAAAALVVLDHPWCVDEIASALADPSTSDDVPALRAALTLLTGAPDDGGDADAELRFSIDSLTPRLAPLRETLKHLPQWERARSDDDAGSLLSPAKEPRRRG